MCDVGASPASDDGHNPLIGMVDLLDCDDGFGCFLQLDNAIYADCQLERQFDSRSLGARKKLANYAQS